MMKSTCRHLCLCVLAVAVLCILAAGYSGAQVEQPETNAHTPAKETALDVHYLEIVTPEVDATCAALEKIHGVTFGEAVPSLGNARTTAMHDGGRIGVRAPMHEAETPVVRSYVLVDDIHAAVEAARTSGGEIAMDATEAPGQGTFAIYFQGGIQYGLWQR